MLKKYLFWLLVILAIVGIADALYLTYEHYYPLAVPCHVNGIVDCGKVLRSKYALIFGIPLGIYGLIYYFSVFLLLIAALTKKFKKSASYLILGISLFAFLFSIYLVYCQLVLLNAICLYCMLSALTSTLIFLISQAVFVVERKELAASATGLIYRNFLKKIFFKIDPETVHEHMLSFGEFSGNNLLIKSITKYLFVLNNDMLRQKVAGIDFRFPVGMAAGFDYEAKLTQFLPSLAFGFQTVGTITNMPYEGNPKPRLGRLPKSLSLMVNKGFKNKGAEFIAGKMSRLNFDYAQGVSIGRSNNEKLTDQAASVKDIIKAFQIFEKQRVTNSYYELNISCPNLIHGSVDFYTPANLDSLLTAVDKLKLKKSLFIKMPIEKSNTEVLGMLKVIARHSPAGVIFGNLQKDRNHKTLNKEEVAQFKTGFFSGKPTYERSNELIRLAYKKYGKKLIIIGCGGVFSVEEAYEKIKSGATLVQLITGLIYMGPQLASEINSGLGELLKRDGYNHISEAVGTSVRRKK